MKKVFVGCVGLVWSLVSMTSFAESKIHYGPPSMVSKSTGSVKTILKEGVVLQVINFTDQFYDVYMQQYGYPMDRRPTLIYPLSRAPLNQLTLEPEYPQRWLNWPIYVEIDYPNTRMPIASLDVFPDHPTVEIHSYFSGAANKKAAPKLIAH